MMSRLVIDFPPRTIFSLELEIHNTHINRGDHVGNSSYVELCNEVSLQFFRSRNINEYTVGNKVLLNTDFSVSLASEAKYLDVLIAELAADDFHRCGCSFFFRFTQKRSEQLVALARFSFLTFDYSNGAVVDSGSGFQEFFKTGI